MLILSAFLIIYGLVRTICASQPAWRLKPRLDRKTPPAWGSKRRERMHTHLVPIFFLNPTEVGFRALAVVSTARQWYSANQLDLLATLALTNG